METTPSGANKNLLKKADVKPVDPLRLGNSPARNSEAEDVMRQYIEKSAQAGGWVRLPLEGLRANADLGTNRMSFESPEREAIINLRQSGLFVLKEDKGEQYLEPTQRFFDYYSRISK